MKRISLLLILFLLVTISPALLLAQETEEFIVQKCGDSGWRYFKGTKTPSRIASSWRRLTFDDSGWLQGRAPFYYGGNITSGTLLSDMRYNYSSVYMRKKFTLKEGDYCKLSINVLCDDGFVLYLNGTEVCRVNVPDGSLSYDSVAPELVTVAEWCHYDLDDYARLLVPGENIIAVQGLNLSLGDSGDFAFDLELSTAIEVPDEVAPSVSEVIPSGATDSTDAPVMMNPPRISILFDETVQNVSTNALLCNGLPARELLTRENVPGMYIFLYDDITADGVLEVAWNREWLTSEKGQITDKAGNVFVPDQEPWYYFLDTSLVRPSVVINEFLASNITINKSRSGEYLDWIELYNRDEVTVDLSGWYLTDSKKDLTMWAFPQRTTLDPGAYLLVYCDSTQNPRMYSEYHANFSLSKDGEYLALVKPDGVTIAHEISSAYPRQKNDISYGLGEELGEYWYFTTPTPGAANGEGSVGIVGDIQFSEPRGYKMKAFNLVLSSETEGATIYYTTDGTVPTTESPRYTSPLKIDKITTLRTMGVKKGYVNSNVSTRTWLFLDEVLAQPTSTPKGWPDSYGVNWHKMEYGMNQKIVNSEKYRERILKGMTDLKTISMVTDLKNLFDGSRGIYVNPGYDGIDWERPISLELIDPDGGDEFQIDAGVRIRGAASRSSDNPKHSFRMFFRSKYAGNLKFPLFGNEGVSEFDKVDFRTSQNYSWAFEQTPYDTFIRETFARDAQRDVGMPYTRSRYYHFFINGQYWGIYQTQERSETSYAESYLGGQSEDWDLLKTEPNSRATVVSEGTTKAAQEFHKLVVQEGVSGSHANNYWRLKGMNPDGTVNPNYPAYLDEDNLLEYMLNVYVTCDMDSPISVWGGFANNLFGLYNRVEPTGFKWFRHDGEHAMWGRRAYGYGENINLVNEGWYGYDTFDKFNPMRIHQKLMDHPDYRMKFIDLYQKRVLDPNGAFTYAANIQRWNARQEELDNAIVVESARWGHGNTRETWLAECDYVKNTFFKIYPSQLDSYLRDRGWLSDVLAPELVAPIMEDTPMRLRGSGRVYYTTDGSDPRLPGGAVSEQASYLDGGSGSMITLVAKGSDWTYYSAGAAPARLNGFSWYIPLYKDSAWEKGTAPLGYGGKETTGIPSTFADKKIVTSYFRHAFDLPSDMKVSSITLSLACDDGAVVYLNGGEILRHNMPEASQYVTYASSDVSGDDETGYTTYTIANTSLKAMGNVIAVEVHQSSAESEDLYFDLELSTEDKGSGQSFMVDMPIDPHSYIKARAFDGQNWSALAEVDNRLKANFSDLKVTELNYSPDKPSWADERGWSRDDFAWIELQNTGAGLLELEGVQFVAGINYVFPNVTLNAGEYIVLAKNLEAFQSVYSLDGVQILSGYSGNLARKGEELILQAPNGRNILTFTYSNQWYPQTDKEGYSLVVKNVDAAEYVWSTAENWRASYIYGGTPGMAEAAVAPRITGIQLREDGSLCLGVETAVQSCFVEFSMDCKTWSLLNDWQWSDNQIIIPAGALDETGMYFRLGI